MEKPIDGLSFLAKGYDMFLSSWMDEGFRIPFFGWLIWLGTWVFVFIVAYNGLHYLLGDMKFLWKWFSS